MAYGAAVVDADVEGIPTVIGEQYEEIIIERDSYEISSTVQNIISNLLFYSKIRNPIPRLEWKNIIESICELYRRLVIA